MKEGIGGVFTLTAIIIALIVIMCLMAFAVNYSKAFRVKDEIRSIIEKNDGLTEDAEDQICTMARRYQYFLNEDVYRRACSNLGYDLFVGSGNSNCSGVFFCIKCHAADSISGNTIGSEDFRNSKYKGAYYSVATFVNVDIPLVNNVIPMFATFFRVSGETALIYSEGNNNSYCTGL